VGVKYFKLRTVLVAAAMTGLVGCGRSTASLAANAGPSHHSPTTISQDLTPTGEIPVVGVRRVGRFGWILVDDRGFTLYRLPSETAGGVGALTCVGACAITWPPLRLPAGDIGPVRGSGVPGLLDLVQRSGQSQVSYEGSPLYLFSGDHAAGQANGEGIDGTWSVVKVVPIFGRARA
jgi:predicted lipoprotein with Yx(FWY)xxD motif